MENEVVLVDVLLKLAKTWVSAHDGFEEAYGALLSYLVSLHLPCACSPVHSRDEYDEHDVRNWRRHFLDPDTGRPTEENL